MLNEKGEYDTTKGTERGIGYYENVLDKLASEFASTMNKANSTNANQDNKALFTAADGVSSINAANISLSSAWNHATGSYLTVTKQDPITGAASSTPSDNILYMIKQLSQEKPYTTDPNNAASGTTLFTGSVNTFISNISNSTLALQVQDIARQDATFNSTLSDIETQKNALSSVDVNEEGINLIMSHWSCLLP